MEPELVFSPDEYQHRLDGVRAEMSKSGIDVLITHSPENMYYMTGNALNAYIVALRANARLAALCVANGLPASAAQTGPSHLL